MKARAYAVHRLAGRVRFKVPGRRADRQFFDEIERRLRQLDTVTNVRTNPTSASVLVEHKGEIADLAEAAMGSGVGELVDIVLGSPPLARRLHAEMVKIDRAVRRATSGEVDLGTIASLGLLAMAAVQLFRRQQPAIAVSLGWYATELLRRSADANAATGREAA